MSFWEGGKLCLLHLSPWKRFIDSVIVEKRMWELSLIVCVYDNVGFRGKMSLSRSSHFLIFFYSSHKGTYQWLTCYEKQEHTFQAMTWRMLEQYSAGKCDLWGSPKMDVEWDGFSEETQNWSTFNKQLGPWHMREFFLWQMNNKATSEVMKWRINSVLKHQ